MKKNGKKETKHLVASADAKITVCGRPIGKVLLWAKKGEPKADDPTVCGRCRKLRAGRQEKAEKALEKTSGPHGPRKTTIDIPIEARKPGKRQPALLALGDRMPEILKVTFKGTEHVASVGVDGSIVVIGQDATFYSPSRAGKAVAGREVDGWTFWSYMKEDGSLEKLDALRKAVA